MKKLRRAAFLVLAVVMLLFCVGCENFIELFDNEEIRTYTETMLDAVVADDFDSAYAVVDDVCTEDAFEAAFGEMKGVLSNVRTYELSLLSIYQNSSLEVGTVIDSVTASYKMTTDSDIFIVDVETNSAYEKLSCFYITPYEKTDYYYTGTISTMKNASLAQWLVLMLNLIIIAVSVLAVVDCCRNRIKLKALWIIVILLGFVTFGATIGASSLNFNFNIGWLFTYSAYILYGGGTTVFRIMLPVGAVLYFVLKKQLIVKPVDLPESDPIIA